FSLVGFGGVGGAWTGAFGFDRSEAVYTGGGGFRYEIARKHGPHMGAGFAFGEKGVVLFIQFRSAWVRALAQRGFSTWKVSSTIESHETGPLPCPCNLSRRSWARSPDSGSIR